MSTNIQIDDLFAWSYIMEVGGFNNPEIDKYMDGIGEIIFAEKSD